MRQRSAWTLALIITALALGFLPVAATYITRYSIPLSSAAGIYCGFLILLIYVIAPGLSAGRTFLRIAIERRYSTFVVAGLLAVPYLIYSAGTGDFRSSSLLQLLAIVAVPLLLYSAQPVRHPAKFNWQDAVVAVWLVSIVLFHWFNGIWTVPANLDFMGRLLLAALGILSWTYIRPVPDLGYRLTFDTRALSAAAINFALFAAVAIPLGFALGFTAWNPRWHGLADFLASYLEILLFIALLEEVFFRGFLQNLLSKSFGSGWRGQAVASCIFGLFHILHAPFPNWRYVVLASVAGWFYGSAYRWGGTLVSSILVHTTVDALWRTFFTRP